MEKQTSPHIGCGAIIINDKDEVLLVKRSVNARIEPGTYSRPGGKLDWGESVESAAERETFEETGIVVKVTQIYDAQPFKMGNDDWMAIGCLAEYVSGEPINREPTKHDWVGWRHINDLPEPLSKYTRNSLEKVLRNRK
jgi:mutator protein MutT